MKNLIPQLQLFLKRHDLAIVKYALIISRPDLCAVCGEKTVQKLLLVQNTAARLQTSPNYIDPILPTLTIFHWFLLIKLYTVWA